MSLFSDMESPGDSTPVSVHSFCSTSCEELATCLCAILTEYLKGRNDSNIVGFRGSLAEKALNVIQKVAALFIPLFEKSLIVFMFIEYQIADYSSQYQRLLRALLMRLAKTSNMLPKSLFLNGVSLNHHFDLPSGGGFSDIHIGEYKNQTVALKVLRIFSNMSESTRNELLQASHLVLSRDLYIVVTIRRDYHTKLYFGVMLPMIIFFLS